MSDLLPPEGDTSRCVRRQSINMVCGKGRDHAWHNRVFFTPYGSEWDHAHRFVAEAEA